MAQDYVDPDDVSAKPHYDTILKDFIKMNRYKQIKNGGGSREIFACEKSNSVACDALRKYSDAYFLDHDTIIAKLRKSKKVAYIDSIADLPDELLAKVLHDGSLKKCDYKLLESFLFTSTTLHVTKNTFANTLQIKTIQQANSSVANMITLVGVSALGLDWTSRTGTNVNKINKDCRKLFVGYMNYFDKKISVRSGHNITKLLAFLIELSIILYNMGNWRNGDTLAESRRRFTDVLTHYEAFYDLDATRRMDKLLQLNSGKSENQVKADSLPIFDEIRIHIMLVWAIVSSVRITCSSFTSTYDIGFQDIDSGRIRKLRLARNKAAVYPVDVMTETTAGELVLFRMLLMTDKENSLYFVPVTVQALEFDQDVKQISSSNFAIFSSISRNLSNLVENVLDFRVVMNFHEAAPYYTMFSKIYTKLADKTSPWQHKTYPRSLTKWADEYSNVLHPLLMCHVARNLLLNPSLTVQEVWQNLLSMFITTGICTDVSVVDDFSLQLLKAALKSEETDDFEKVLLTVLSRSRYNSFASFLAIDRKYTVYLMRASASMTKSDRLYETIARISDAWTDINSRFTSVQGQATARRFMIEIQQIAKDLKLEKVLPHFPSNYVYT